MRHWDEDLAILTAENVNFAVETAGLGSRFAAALIDLTIQFFAIWAVVMVFFMLAVRFGFNAGFEQVVSSIAIAILILVLFLIGYGYYFFFEWLMRGQTPGKYFLGLRVVQTSGLPVTLWPALVRNLLRIVDFLPIMYGVGAFVAMSNTLNRRVGDLAAGTVVARERRQERGRYVLDIGTAADAFLANTVDANYAGVAADREPASFPALVETSAPAPIAATAPTINGIDAQATAWRLRLNDQDYELLHEFLQRRNSMQAQARLRLGQSLAQRICVKIGEPLPTPHFVEPFLESIAGILQRSP